MMPELAALVIVIVFLAWDRRQTMLVLSRARAREPDLVRVISELCQRIQAPAVAVAEHTATVLPGEAPQHVPMDDDEAFWGTKETLAALAAEQERNGRHGTG